MALTVPVVISYRKTGTRPPVYVAGSFSSPQWQPQEMEYSTEEDGEHTFRKEIRMEPESKAQYKFRLGPGDWWALDESAPSGKIRHLPLLLQVLPSTSGHPEIDVSSLAIDESGNQNNVLTAPRVPTSELQQGTAPDASGGSAEYQVTANVKDEAAIKPSNDANPPATVDGHEVKTDILVAS
jgi:hypothetical protein